MANLTLAGFDTALALEWAVISTGVRARRTAASWCLEEPVLAGCSSPREVLDLIVEGPIDASVAASRAVLRLATGDELAARLLVQVMVPTLATECWRTARTMARAGVPADDGEVVALVVGAAAEAIGAYSRLVVPFPLRTLRRRTIEIVTGRRSRMIDDARRSSGALPDDERLDLGLGGPSAAELLAETLATAVQFGVVSGEDAELVWATRFHDVDTRMLSSGDRRENERLRRRRSRAQQRLIEHRDLFVEAGIAV